MAEAIEVSIPYGTGALSVTVPRTSFLGTALAAKPLIPAADEASAVQRALEQPVGAKLLRDTLKTTDTVAVIVSDYTRPTPSGIILGPVLAELARIGISKENISIVVACGLHEPSPPESLVRMLGQDIIDNYKVVNHNADDLENLVPVGTTNGGIPVKINRLVAEADFRLAIGAIDPHRFAGWSGGAKNLLPGVAARETVNAHHVLLTHTSSRLGTTGENPFRVQLEEAARLARLDYIVNVVLSADKRIAYAVAGDAVEAHRAGVSYAEARIRAEVAVKADVVIASPGGAPRDSEFWQTEGKCLGTVSEVIRDGGTLIVAAQCSKGVGNPEFAEYLTMTVAGIEEAFAKRPFSMALAKAYKFAVLAQRVNVYLVSEGIGAVDLPNFPVKFFLTLQDALQHALEDYPQAKVLAIPDAAGVVLKLSEV